MTEVPFCIATQFSKRCGARFIRQGPDSAEALLEQLEPLLCQIETEDLRLVLDLDGGYGYAHSFLDALFRGIGRRLGAQVTEKLRVQTEQAEWKEEILEILLEEAGLDKMPHEVIRPTTARRQLAVAESPMRAPPDFAQWKFREFELHYHHKKGWALWVLGMNLLAFNKGVPGSSDKGSSRQFLKWFDPIPTRSAASLEFLITELADLRAAIEEHKPHGTALFAQKLARDHAAFLVFVDLLLEDGHFPASPVSEPGRGRPDPEV